jgi:hypothetical protein
VGTYISLRLSLARVSCGVYKVDPFSRTANPRAVATLFGDVHSGRSSANGSAELDASVVSPYAAPSSASFLLGPAAANTNALLAISHFCQSAFVFCLFSLCCTASCTTTRFITSLSTVFLSAVDLLTPVSWPPSQHTNSRRTCSSFLFFRLCLSFPPCFLIYCLCPLPVSRSSSLQLTPPLDRLFPVLLPPAVISIWPGPGHAFLDASLECSSHSM